MSQSRRHEKRIPFDKVKADLIKTGSCVAGYRLAITESAAKELKRLPKTFTARIAGRIEKLATNPRPSGCKKPKGGTNEWRIRIGDYCDIYEIEDAAMA